MSIQRFRVIGTQIRYDKRVMLVVVRGMRLIVGWMLLLLRELEYLRRNSLGLFVVHDVDGRRS